MNIVGISALYHDSACCILKNGRLIAAAQEERFTRKKNESSLPIESFKYCLREANLSISDIDYLAYYEIPEKKMSRQLWCGYDMHYEYNNEKNPIKTDSEIRSALGYDGPIIYVEHHVSHAFSADFRFARKSTKTLSGKHPRTPLTQINLRLRIATFHVPTL